MRKNIFNLTLLLVLFIFSFASAEETLTITTYYPSPYGSYNTIYTDKLGVGDNNSDGKATSADVPATIGDVWIKGNVGIGTISPGAKLDVNGNVKISGGDPGVNKILTSDADGLASWQPALTKGIQILVCPTVPAATGYCNNIQYLRNGRAPCHGQLTTSSIPSCYNLNAACDWDGTWSNCTPIGYLVD